MKPIYYIIFLLCLTNLLTSKNYAIGQAGQECVFYAPVEEFPYPNGSFTVYDCSSTLPGAGTFVNGTSSITGGVSWVADTSGGGQVIPYPVSSGDTYGEVGLRCSAGQTVILELSGPISVTTTGGDSPFEWDQFCFCIHYRANTTANNPNRIVAGKFYAEMYDAYGTQNTQESMVDVTYDSSNPVVLGTDSTHLNFAHQGTSYHGNWNQVSNFKLVYTVPAGSAPTTEILVERVILLAFHFYRNPN